MVSHGIVFTYCAFMCKKQNQNKPTTSPLGICALNLLSEMAVEMWPMKHSWLILQALYHPEPAAENVIKFNNS